MSAEPATPTTRVFTFTVRYFRRSGQFYLEAEFDLTTTVLNGRQPCMEEARNRITTLRDRILRGECGWVLPGLGPEEGWDNGFIIVDHPAGYPWLIPPVGMGRE